MMTSLPSCSAGIDISNLSHFCYRRSVSLAKENNCLVGKISLRGRHFLCSLKADEEGERSAYKF